MTALISDFCIYEDERYNVIGKTDWKFFDPRIFGIKPGVCCTAVGRGYWCVYTIKNNKLLLDVLNIYSADNYYPDIRGVSATDPGYEDYKTTDGRLYQEHKKYGCWIYKGLGVDISYTGRFLLGADRLKGADYVNYGGIDRYWKYKKLISLEFENGHLTEVWDVSDIGKKVRLRIKENRTYIESYGFIEEYKLEKLAESMLDKKLWWIKS